MTVFGLEILLCRRRSVAAGAPFTTLRALRAGSGGPPPPQAGEDEGYPRIKSGG